MATVTRNAASFDSGRCVWEYDYDGVQLRLTQVRCINNSAFPTRGTITVNSNGRQFSALVAAGGTLNQNVPTGLQNRLDISIDSRGRVDGIDWAFAWGAQVV